MIRTRLLICIMICLTLCRTSSCLSGPSSIFLCLVPAQEFRKWCMLRHNIVVLMFHLCMNTMVVANQEYKLHIQHIPDIWNIFYIWHIYYIRHIFHIYIDLNTHIDFLWCFHRMVKTMRLSNDLRKKTSTSGFLRDSCNIDLGATASGPDRWHWNYSVFYARRGGRLSLRVLWHTKKRIRWQSMVVHQHVGPEVGHKPVKVWWIQSTGRSWCQILHMSNEIYIWNMWNM